MGSLATQGITLIREAIEKAENPVIAFSGGKDSTVVLDLVRRVDDSVPVVFCNTGVENIDTIRYSRSIDNLVELKAEKTFWQCIDEYGWPDVKGKAKSHGNQCCRWLKERPADQYYKANKIDLVFTGLTAAESRNRWMMLRRMGPLYKMKSGLQQWKCHPIHDWKVIDVWDYIKDRGLVYNPIYDNGAVRCGCMPCTAYISWKERLFRENPKLYLLVVKKRREDGLELRDNLPCGGT